MAEYRHYDTIMAMFVAVLLISNIASTKILTLWKFSFDGGTLLFPLSYIFGDILTEVYGYSKARRVIWTGFAAAALMSITFMLVQILPPAQGWDNQDAYMKILGVTWRIVLASLAAFFVGEFSNSYTLAKLKIKTNGRMLWLRTIISTLVGEGLDTVIFVLVAFAGVLPSSLLVAVAVSNYIFKSGVEIIFTPATYAVVSYLKRAEKIDHYDYKTDFNPFRA